MQEQLEATSTSQAPLEVLILRLRDEDPEVRWAAATGLGAHRDPRVVGSLLPLLADTNSRVRTGIIQSLALLGDQSAVLPLIEALKHPDRNTRIAAVNALGDLGDTRAIGPIRAIVQTQSDDNLERIGVALSKLGEQGNLVSREQSRRNRFTRRQEGTNRALVSFVIGAILFSISLGMLAFTHFYALGHGGGFFYYSPALFIIGAFLMVISPIIWIISRF